MTAAGARRSRLGRWGLWISLAINIFLAAAIASHLLVNRPDRPRGLGPRIDRIAASLPAADGDRLRAAFEARSAEIAEARSAFREAQDRIRDALAREPFDAAAVREAMAGARGAREAFDAALHETVFEAAAAMSAEGRASLAQWQSRRGRRDAAKREDR
jgi:uncharacterized membrane protein